MPIECTVPHTYVPDSLHYYQVINTYLVDEEPTVDLTPLIPLQYERTSSPIQIKVAKRWKNLTTVAGSIRIPNKHKRAIIVSKAKDLYQIKTYTALPIRYHFRKHMAYLIMTTDNASLVNSDYNYSGRTTPIHITDIIRISYRIVSYRVNEASSLDLKRRRGWSRTEPCTASSTKAYMKPPGIHKRQTG